MSATSASGIEALTGSLLGLAVVTVGLRFFSRIKLKNPCLVDDWLMLLALVSFIGVSTCVLLLVHLKDIGYSSFQFTTAEKIAAHDTSVQVQRALVVTTIACLACTKASALFFYKRVFMVGSHSHRVFNIFIIGSVAVIACWFVTFVIMTIYQCKGHVSGLYDPKVYTKYCTTTYDFLYGFSVSDVLLDAWVLALPIPKILCLHTTATKKLYILAIFMVGCVALASSIARLVIYVQIYTIGVTTLKKLDTERYLTRNTFFYVLECGCSILAINLPSVWSILGGQGLENITKMARSVTSLISSGSGRSRSKSDSLDRNSLSEADMIHYQDKSGSSNSSQDLAIDTEAALPRHEIIRKDSVLISTEVRKPQDAYRREEEWA